MTNTLEGVVRAVTSLLVCALTLVEVSSLNAAPQQNSQFSSLGDWIAHESFAPAKIGEAFTHEFLWTNRTARTLQIRSVNPSCDCVKVMSFPKSIAPAQVGRLGVEVTPRVAGASDWILFAEVEENSRLQLFGLSGTVLADQAITMTDGLLVQPRDFANVGADLKNVMFVDVRSQDEFRAAHIPGAINLPLYTIKGRGFLRSKRLVLVNEGHSHQSLLEEVARLRQLHFDSVAILNGGMRGWQQAGGPLDGENPTSASLSTITALQFFQARAEPGWLVIAVQASSAKSAATALPANLTLDADAVTAENINNLIRANPTTRRILFAAVDDLGDRKIEAILREGNSIPAYRLQGGVNAYAEVLAAQFAQQDRRTVTISSQQQTQSRFNNGARASGKTGRCCGGS